MFNQSIKQEKRVIVLRRSCLVGRGAKTKEYSNTDS